MATKKQEGDVRVVYERALLQARRTRVRYTPDGQKIEEEFWVPLAVANHDVAYESWTLEVVGDGLPRVSTTGLAEKDLLPRGVALEGLLAEADKQRESIQALISPEGS